MKFAFFSHKVTDNAVAELVSLSGKKSPKEINLAFISTAANLYNPDPDWLLENLNAFKDYGFKVERFDLEGAYNMKTDIRKFLEHIDLVFVSGGNVFYLIYWMNKTKFKDIIKNFLEQGKVYSGGSAGAVCMFKDLTPLALVDDPTEAPEALYEGLNLTDLIVIPHWGSPDFQNELEKIKDYYVKKGLKTIEISDEQAVIQDGEKVKIIN